MNQKIPFHDLSARIASATGISVENAEQFVKNFFELLSESLVKGENVKIKGLGSFAVADVDGERSVEFTPDKEMADSINAPFAMFEPVKLNEAVSDEMLSEISAGEESEAAPETAMDAGDEVITQPAAPLPPETPALVPAEEESAVEEVPEPVKPTETVVEDNQVDLSVPAVEVDEELEAKTIESDATEPVKPLVQTATEPTPPPVQPAPPVTLVPPVAPAAPHVSAPSISPLEEEPEEYVDRRESRQSGGGNGNFWLGLIIGLIVGLALGACAVYLAIDRLFPTNRQALAEEETTELLEENPTVDAVEATAPADSLADAAPAAAEPTKTDSAAPAPAAAAPVAQAEAPATAPEPKITKDTVRSGYLIHDMAKKFYGNKDFWVYIYEENKSKIGNPNRMQPGVVLVIPPAEKYGIDPNSAESLRKAKRKAGEILSKYPR